MVLKTLNYGSKSPIIYIKKQGWNVLLHIYIYQLVNLVWTNICIITIILQMVQ